MLNKLKQIGNRLEGKFPSLWEYRFRLPVFVILFLLFFAINWYALNLPEIIRKNLNRSSLAHISYSDATVKIFPLGLELKGVTLGGPILRGASLSFDKLTISPVIWRLFTGKGGIHIIAASGKGNMELSATTGSSFDFFRTSFDLEVENMPLSVIEALEQFDPDAGGTVSARAKGEARWVNAAGMVIPRDCDIAADGRITIASARNGLAALTFERFRNGIFNFDLTVAGRIATIKRMDFTDQSCSVVVNGKAVLDWRNVADSELNLTVEAKARVEDITPALLNDEIRRRLDHGQTLPFAMQGTLGNVQMKPVF